MKRTPSRTWGTVALVGVLCAGAGAFAGSQLAQTGDPAADEVAASIDQQTPDSGEIRIYPQNESGQTWGTPETGALDPELVLAEATNGEVGYVFSSDLIGPEYSSPQEAYEASPSTSQESPGSIPVYAVDGATVIGEFVFSPSE